MVILLAGAGGFLGASLRYLVVNWVYDAAGQAGFPYGTLVVNALGCLLIGVVVGLAEARQPLSAGTQAFLVVGILGGFTTFSAFGIDTIRLVREGAILAGVLNVALQVAVGLSAAAVAIILVQWVHGRLTSG